MSTHLSRLKNLQGLFFYLILIALVGCGSEKKDNDEKNSYSQKQDSVNTVAGDKQGNRKVIVFFGNSLTAGYGLDPQQSFPALIQDKLDSLGLNYEVVNAGLSGETTASGKNRLEWILKQDIDVFVLELGANDGLRGINLDETRKNLQEIIDQVKATNADVKIVLAGMKIPPNMGADYTERFQQIFPELAQKNDLYLIPFLLEDVAGERELNQADGIHPSAEGAKIVAENVWEVLENVLPTEQKKD